MKNKVIVSLASLCLAVAAIAQDLGSTQVQDQYGNVVRLPRTLDRGWRLTTQTITNSGQTISFNVDLVFVNTTANASNILVYLPQINTNQINQNYNHEIDILKTDVVATQAAMVASYTNGPGGLGYGSNFISSFGLWSPVTLATNAVVSNYVAQISFTNGFLLYRFIPDNSGSNWVAIPSGR